ncbi:hypothetical protein JI735_34285 (plasmid) [Paenibacillus sonchi]|uniref:Uncharacterized protein n=1 Tax=Paenibacillus sonchi TaxID=373687 RepID=A0A974PJL2_9BACL|nr:hypothetical protein [Paenibacillus sonchi]QQZ64686.1 hypothetical protein JI735_34285 [Paenibacillus sonchi]
MADYAAEAVNRMLQIGWLQGNSGLIQPEGTELQVETKNDTAVITDHEFVETAACGQAKQPEVMLRIIERFQGDIETISQRIRIPREDAVSHIVTELFAYIYVEDTS